MSGAAWTKCLAPPIFLLFSYLAQALAILDALSGGGDAFWTTFSNALLPEPAELTLPLCMPTSMLPELQHKGIIEGAMQQKERLGALFPGLARPACEGGQAVRILCTLSV
jgi:hypothetical protein